MSRRALFLIGVLVAECFYLGLVIFHRESLLASDNTVRLRVIPKDPRSLFSGDYVILNYKISGFDKKAWDDLWQGTSPVRPGPVFVSLVPDPAEQGFFTAGSISPYEPDQGIYLRGQVEYPDSTFISVRYNLESYFVPQNCGLILEKANFKRQVSVDVSVGAGGEAALKKLYVKNKEVDFTGTDVRCRKIKE